MKSKIKRMATGLAAVVILATSGGVIASAAAPSTSVQTIVKQTAALEGRTLEELGKIVDGQSSSATKTDVLKLLEDYEAKAAEANAAEEALLNGLEVYGVEAYETDGALDTAKIEAAINKLKDKNAAAELKKLLTAYKNAVAEEEAAREALIGAMEKAGYNK